MTLTFEERLARLAETDLNMERIKNIEKCFGNDNKKSLCVAGRALVGEGVLIKECRKKPKPRYFFLFNDVLVYELRNGWLIMSPKKTFCVYATTSREKLEWMTHISNCIEKLSNNKRKAYDTVKNVEVAPQWIPDKDADTCMRCQVTKFNVVNRRHHCRNCGYVVCGDCSKNKFMLPSQSDQPLRVCNNCYKNLSNFSTGENKNEITSAISDSSDESDNEDQASASNENNENDTQFYSKY